MVGVHPGLGDSGVRKGLGVGRRDANAVEGGVAQTPGESSAAACDLKAEGDGAHRAWQAAHANLWSVSVGLAHALCARCLCRSSGGHGQKQRPA